MTINDGLYDVIHNHHMIISFAQPLSQPSPPHCCRGWGQAGRSITATSGGPSSFNQAMLKGWLRDGQGMATGWLRDGSEMGRRCLVDDLMIVH